MEKKGLPIFGMLSILLIILSIIMYYNLSNAIEGLGLNPEAPRWDLTFKLIVSIGFTSLALVVLVIYKVLKKD